MTTTQNDAATMTGDQLDAVAGGLALSEYALMLTRRNAMQRSNSTMDTGRRASFVSISPIPTPIP